MSAAGRVSARTGPFHRIRDYVPPGLGALSGHGQ